MQTQRVNRTDAEKVYLVVKNVEAVTATTGLGMRYASGANAVAEIVSTDGVNAVLFDADAYGGEMAGIAVEDIASNGYGRVQAWGFVNSVLISAIADKTANPTDISQSFLKKGGTAGSFITGGGPEAEVISAQFKYVQILNTVNISGGLNYAKGFIRAL